MKIERREFGLQMLTFLWANIFLTSCSGGSTTRNPNSPTAPLAPVLPDKKSLLKRVIELGHQSAGATVEEKFPGASRIAIKGDVNWNFLVGDELVKIGPPSSNPTDNIPLIEVPNTKTVVVRSF